MIRLPLFLLGMAVVALSVRRIPQRIALKEDGWTDWGEPER